MSWLTREIKSPLLLLLLMLTLSAVGGVGLAMSWELSDWRAVVRILILSVIGAVVFQYGVKLKQ